MNISSFTKNVLTLVSGVTIAQGVTIIVSFALARIYTPAEFGIYTFFISIVSIVGPNINARFENAIILPTDEKETYNLVWLGFIINNIVSLFFLIVIVIFKTYLLHFFNVEKLDFWVYFIPLVIWLTGIYNSLTLLNTKLKSFKNIAQTVIYRTITASVSQIGLKYIFQSLNGLILGNILSQFVGNIKLLSSSGGILKFRHYFDKVLIKQMAIKYIDFPKFSLPGSILNATTRNIINIASSKLYNVDIVGQYSMVKRLLALPSSFVSSSVSKVFLEASSTEKKENGNATAILKNTLTKLIGLSILFYGILYFIVEDVFVLFYGEIWRDAGIYAQIMLPSFAAAFIVSPVSVIMEIFEKQKLFLGWQIFNFTSVGVILYLSYINSYSFTLFLGYFNWIIVLQYCILLIMVIKTAKGNHE